MTDITLSFSKNTLFDDDPPTGALAGKFDNCDPSPLKDVAVQIPAIMTPVFVVSNFLLSEKYNSADPDCPLKYLLPAGVLICTILLLTNKLP